MMPLEATQTSESDRLTVLTSAGPRLTKIWDSATGRPQGYENAQQFSVQERYVSNIFELGRLLDELESQRNSCLIRGKFIGHDQARKLYPAEIEWDRKRGKTLPMPKDGFTLRRKSFFTEQPLHYFYGDIDNFRPDGIDPVTQPELAIQQYIAQKLPPCFQGVTFHWQLSSGAGHPDNVGLLKAHVAFWLSKATGGDDLELWAKAIGLDIDVTVFRVVQPNYTAAPIFNEGVKDPVPRRSGLCEGLLGDEVDLVIDPAVLLAAKTERKTRQNMVDPRDKEGPVGAFCRAFEIEQVVEQFLPDVFEFVTEWRLNWLQSSSGAPEGVGVCDNRQGLFNTHSSDPLNGRATNKWDLVRHYKFGHLDADLDQAEKVLLGIGGWPSNQAMLDWVKTLPEMAAQATKASDSHRDAIAAAIDESGLREVAQRISLDGSIDQVAKDMLAAELRDRFGDVLGRKPSISSVRKLIGMNKRRVLQTVESGPNWLQGWCYVTGQARFFHLGSKELITSSAFDAKYCRFMQPNMFGELPSAAKAACDDWRIPTVYETMYLPSVGDLFTVDGKEFANLYRPESVPTGVFDPAANAVFDRHIALIIPDADYRRIFKEWAAWVVTHPGHKVLWAVFIKGIEGDGKTVLGSMMAQAMGHENVGIISPETLSGSNFNDWAGGRCLNVLEELKLQGHNRHDVANKIKPLITNTRIELHRKNKASITAVNTANYLAFSNHVDALPIDQNDRRQFILFSPWKEITEMHEAIQAMGLSVEEYWDELWKVVKNRPDAVRGYFESIDITAFDPHSRAPDTSFKEQVVMANDTDDAEAFARHFIETGCVGVSDRVVSSSQLSKSLSALEPPVFLHTTRMRKLLSGQGFTPLEKVIKWNGSSHRVWVKDAVTSKVTSQELSRVRALLDQTLPSAGNDFLN